MRESRKGFDFGAWMDVVDRILSLRLGIDSADLPDQRYADWFESGLSPAKAARLALQYAGGL